MAQTSNFSDGDMLVKQFLDAIKENDKVEEFHTKFAAHSTTEEMFAYFWDLDEAHNILTPTVIPPQKSEEDAAEYCRQGKIAYRHHHLAEALKCYNLAILTAPHPNSEPGNFSENKASSINPDTCSVLAQAFEARSAILFDMKQYETCSADVDLALKLEHQQSSHKRLLDMKAKCQKFIPAGKEMISASSAKALDRNEFCFAYKDPKPPSLAESNPTIRPLSSAVKVAFTETLGRHLIATRDINPGEIVAVEEGYYHMLFAKNLKTRCNVCMKRCSAPLPCPSCSLVVFCSEACQTAGLSSGSHWQECPVLSTFIALDLYGYPLLAYKILMKVSHAKLKEIIPSLQHEASVQAPETLGFNKEGIYDATDYRSLYHLVTNREKRSKGEFFLRCAQAFFTTKLLLQSGRYFLSGYGEPITPTYEDIILTGSTLLHHIMNLSCNVLATNVLEVNLDDYGSSNRKAFGSGVYPAISLMSHSCNPSCSLYSYGKTDVVRALQFIPAGDVVNLAYEEHFHLQDMSSRKISLEKRFYFTCTCHACENEWPTRENFSPIFCLKCIRCGAEIDPCTLTCFKCHLNHDEPSIVAGSHGLAPYNIRHISEKIGVLQEEYDRARNNIFKTDIISDEDIKSVRLLIKLYTKYVHQPCYTLVDAIGTLAYCLSRRGSCEYIRKDDLNNCPSSETLQAIASLNI